MKNVLVLYYTQSGQLGEIARNIASPLVNDPEIKLTFWEVKMKQEFAFPWNGTTFYNAFPESFLQIPSEIEAPSYEILNTKYDLIILGYQVWYLSPSIPTNSLLKSEYARKIFSDTPVVTVSGTRNMWVMAQEKVKVLLKENGARLIGNIALTDRNINHVSVITIVHWMMSGKKTKYLGIFPKPGVSEKEITESPKYGEIIRDHFKQDSLDSLQRDLVAAGAVRIHSFLVQMDRTANKMFKVWSNLIIKRPAKRQGWLTGFKIYLLTAIWIMSPIVYILYLFTYPLKYFKFKKEQSFYEGV